jgi:predicted nucleic acid-binding protein
MIVLDANVVSEAMKPAADPAVRSWLNEQVAETFYLASVTLAELLFEIGALPDGRRKKTLTEMRRRARTVWRSRIAVRYRSCSLLCRACRHRSSRRQGISDARRIYCRHCRLQGIYRRDPR